MKLKMAMTTFSIVALCSISRAQQNTSQSNGVLTPPAPITNVISIDAHNMLLIESGEAGEPKEYSLAIPKHLYSGGIARLFGGTIIPTELLVIPESALRSGAGGNFGRNNSGNTNSNGGNSGNNNFANNNSGGNNTFGNSFNRGSNNFSSRVPLRNLNDFNQALGALDRPVRQAQIGAGN